MKKYRSRQTAKKSGVTLLSVLLSLFILQGCASDDLQPDSLASISNQVDHRIAVGELQQPIMLVINDPRGIRKQFGASGPGYYNQINYAKDPLLARVSKGILDDYGLKPASQWPLRSLGVHCIVIEKPPLAILTQLSADQRISWIQDFNSFDTQISSETKAQKPTVMSPRVTLPNQGHGLDIVIIDTGADIHHPAFDHAKVTYKNFVFGKSNGKEERHGTAVTGLLGAKVASQTTNYNDSALNPELNTQINMQGLSNQADLHHYRGCWQLENGKGKCSTLTLALALDAAVSINPDIINLSLSGPKDRVLDALIDKLIENGSIVVSAHDNNRQADNRFPIGQAGVIYAYGTSDSLPINLPDNTFMAASTAVSLSPSGLYDVFTGHSIATPQVTAITASLLADDPSIEKNTIVKRIEQWLTRSTALN